MIQYRERSFLRGQWCGVRCWRVRDRCTAFSFGILLIRMVRLVPRIRLANGRLDRGLLRCVGVAGTLWRNLPGRGVLGLKGQHWKKHSVLYQRSYSDGRWQGSA
jgi:hypothetical protein